MKKVKKLLEHPTITQIEKTGYPNELAQPEQEKWIDIEGYEGLYQVSDLGKIKSCGKSFIRSNGEKVNLKERILKPFPNRKGYLQVKLYSEFGKKTIPVHRLVATSYLNNSKEKNQVNHINGVKTDNSLRNLEYVDPWENMNHLATVINKKPRGVAFHNGKWQARIVYDSKCINLGHFKEKTEAYKTFYEKFAELRGCSPWDLQTYKTH